MRALLLTAVVGLAATSAPAGPSDHRSREFGDYSRSQRPDLRQRERDRNEARPYALTGDRVQRRVLQFRDVPRGRGQTERLPFWTWASE